MRKFASKIFFFILFVIIVLGLIDFGFSKFLKITTIAQGEYEVWNDIYTSNADCEIAIYGSSRAWVHIDPEILSDSLNKKAYNFGLDGHSFWLQYLRHKEYQKHNKNPKIIIQSVDIFTLEKIEIPYNFNQFLPYMLFNKNIKYYTKPYKYYSEIDFYLPLVRYRGKYIELIKGLENVISGDYKVSFRQKGFKAVDKHWGGDFENAKSKKDYYKIDLDKNVISLFETFIQECKSEGIELILIYTPEHIDGQKYMLNRQDVIDVYKDLAVKYELLFIDYSDDNICLNKDLFYNATHLNRKGAELLSKKIANDLKHR